MMPVATESMSVNARTRTSIVTFASRGSVNGGTISLRPLIIAYPSSRPSAPPSGGEQDVLGQELAHEAPPSGAERGADRDLALARRAARQRQVGEVRAADEQQHPDGAEQHVQRASELRRRRATSA